MTRKVWVVAAALCVAAVLFPSGASAQATASLPEVPATLAGLAVSREKVPGAPKGGRPQLLTKIVLYGLRGENNRLQATLQLGLFRPGEHVDSVAFRRAVATRVGDSVPSRYRVAGHVVYLSRSKQISLAIWFRGRVMSVMSLRTDAQQPKAIIRAALGVSA